MTTRDDYTADCWRGYVWHVLTCRVGCDGRNVDSSCDCSCHRPRGRT